MEYDFYWCFGLRRDEDYEYLKEGSSTIGGDLFASFRKDREKNIYIMKVLCWRVLIDGVR
jgi:hypothetical protein